MLNSFFSNTFSWFCEPGVPLPTESEETKKNLKGAWYLNENGLVIRPDEKRDFWRRTFYTPILIKDDGPCFLTSVSSNSEIVMDVSFSFTPVSQFDQAGVYIRIDSNHHIKAGIEYVDGSPRLSCVVTNVFSDWSTQPWKNWDGKTAKLRIRAHKINQGSSIVIETAVHDTLSSSDLQIPQAPDFSSLPELHSLSNQLSEIKDNFERLSTAVSLVSSLLNQKKEKEAKYLSRFALLHSSCNLNQQDSFVFNNDDNNKKKEITLEKQRWLRAQAVEITWEFARIAHLSSKMIHNDEQDQGGNGEEDWKFGVFSACPIEQNGCVANFEFINFSSKLSLVHSSDL